MKVQFFGRLGERIGRETQLELPADTHDVAGLRHELARLHPHARSDLLSPTLRACVDDVIVPDDAPIRADSEVAFFPPLSGG
ncbi:MAG: MoaD/ThiS family protein [Allosphingosinicella sp.]